MIFFIGFQNLEDEFQKGGQDKKRYCQCLYQNHKLQNKIIEEEERLLNCRQNNNRLSFQGDVKLLMLYCYILHMRYVKQQYNYNCNLFREQLMKNYESSSCSPFKSFPTLQQQNGFNNKFNKQGNPFQQKIDEKYFIKQNIQHQVPNNYFNFPNGFQKIPSNDHQPFRAKQFNNVIQNKPNQPPQISRQFQDQIEVQKEKHLEEFKKLKEVLKVRNSQRLKRQQERLNSVLANDCYQ
ncbi:unnamed protein product (macronuclear) [Paramecium tetraurelia]|uniref:Uncharacterized protein n=1 Tax=Paramecium tetraurelia TaxID=5888 RepID=A0CEQ7_PARTE|nr:uncharacterized protein GSPATT00037713001 [Paramecium tetraurelia]CAK69274.1 unnamed protein product [Paramecium tetraurelia]|eukprot:XP_001436671.1 hypothetical protein (macronuclear) [Paramecium tetraurelia strain d4-2]